MRLSVNLMLFVAFILLLLLGWQSWHEGQAAAVLEAQAEIEHAKAAQQEAQNELLEDAVFWPGLLSFGLLLIVGGFGMMFFSAQRRTEDRMERIVTCMIGEYKAEKLDIETRKEIAEYERLVNIKRLSKRV